MDTMTITLIIQILILVGSYIFGRYILPSMTANQQTIKDVIDQTNLIITWADSFVAYAKQFMKKENGPAKMQMVVEHLLEIAKRNGINLSETEIKAIAQKAYDSMKAGQEAAENEKKKADAVAASTTATAPIIIPQEIINNGVESVPLGTKPGNTMTITVGDNIQ